jgi:hypothetical protein
VRKLLWILSLTAIAAFPATARADGIAFAGVKDGGDGTASADGLLHYVTLPMPKQTVVTKVTAEGSVLKFRTLPGAWGIPMVAFDGSTGGLSAYGRILVLAQPPIGRMRHVSRFPVLETTNLRLVDLVTLEGSFSFDAISPDGSTLYLIEHVNRKDVAEYQVRAYDLAKHRLLPYVIRDHRSSQVEMYGYPMSRATSSDGRWAYTLYQGSHHSFVHALDTEARKAVCVDLPMDTPPEYVADARLALGPGGRNLTVDSTVGGILAVIDTERLALRPRQSNRPAASAGEEGFPWMLIVGALAVASLAASARVRRLRPMPALTPAASPARELASQGSREQRRPAERALFRASSGLAGQLRPNRSVGPFHDDLAARDLRLVRNQTLQLLLAQPVGYDAARLLGLRRSIEEVDRTHDAVTDFDEEVTAEARKLG